MCTFPYNLLNGTARAGVLLCYGDSISAVTRLTSSRPWLGEGSDSPAARRVGVVGLSLASQWAFAFGAGVMMNRWTGTMEKYFNLIFADTNLSVCVMMFRYSPHELIAVWATRLMTGLVQRWCHGFVWRTGTTQ